MARDDVESMLGSPTVSQVSPEAIAWYLPPPKIELHDSPYAMGTIGVSYTSDGRVASVQLNPQFRD
jgi:hypothetical protein